MGFRFTCRVVAITLCVWVGASVSTDGLGRAGASPTEGRLSVLSPIAAVQGLLRELRAFPADDLNELDAFLPRVDDVTFAMAYLLSEDELAATLDALDRPNPLPLMHSCS